MDTPLVYIASPFFDDLSKEWVGYKEEEFRGMHVPYFSPREDGIDFHAVKNTALRSERIKAIFKNNVRNLDKCSHICIYLNPVKGKTDIGTLWELGYFIAKNPNLDFHDDEYSTITAPPGIKDLVPEWIKNLSKLTVPDLKEKPVNSKALIVHNTVVNNIKDSLLLADINYDIIDISADLSFDLGKLAKRNVLLTDDWPDQIFVLAGWLYANKVPYYTASFRNFGSNIMMAASSRGHIQLPGIVDDTFREDLK